MPTPAEVLLENSTLLSGTPWEHLNAQEGGGSGTDDIRYIGDRALQFTVIPKTVLFDFEKVQTYSFEYIDRQED